MEKRQKWLRWRWEFMRRNKEYKADYDKLQSLKKEVEKIEWHKQCRDKWEMQSMIDPNISWDEFVVDPKKKRNSKEKWISIFRQDALDTQGVKIEFFPPNPPIRITAFSRDGLDTQGEEIEFIPPNPPKLLTITIDFSKINSVDALKKTINHYIDQQIEINNNLNNLRKRGHRIACAIPENNLRHDISRINETDFDVILEVGDLKEQGWTNQQIAKKIYPYHFDNNNEDANPESKTRIISEFYKRYRNLVNEEFKKLRYP